jgi:hypothetical protein
MNGKEFVQCELFKDCHNGCRFCFNRKWWGITPREIKLRNIKIAHDFLLSDEMDDFESFGIIGGEFFDEQLDDIDVKNAFFELCHSVCKRISTGELARFQFTSALMFEPTTSKLYTLLDELQTYVCFDKMLLCTSYDTAYRFNSDKQLINWQNNMAKLASDYPKLNLHITAIPTQDFCSKVLSGAFDIDLMRTTYNAHFGIADVHSGWFWDNKYDMEKDVPGFFPQRKTFIDFLTKMYTEGILDVFSICYIDRMAHTVYFTRDGTGELLRQRQGLDHRMPYAYREKSDYIDSDVSLLDDVKDVWEMLGGEWKNDKD